VSRKAWKAISERPEDTTARRSAQIAGVGSPTPWAPRSLSIAFTVGPRARAATAVAIGEPSTAPGRAESRSPRSPASEPGHPRSSARTASTARTWIRWDEDVEQLARDHGRECSRCGLDRRAARAPERRRRRAAERRAPVGPGNTTARAPRRPVEVQLALTATSPRPVADSLPPPAGPGPVNTAPRPRPIGEVYTAVSWLPISTRATTARRSTRMRGLLFNARQK
jgi:hypothetical protein